MIQNTPKVLPFLLSWPKSGTTSRQKFAYPWRAKRKYFSGFQLCFFSLVFLFLLWILMLSDSLGFCFCWLTFCGVRTVFIVKRWILFITVLGFNVSWETASGACLGCVGGLDIFKTNKWYCAFQTGSGHSKEAVWKWETFFYFFFLVSSGSSIQKWAIGGSKGCDMQIQTWQILPWNITPQTVRADSNGDFNYTS